MKKLLLLFFMASAVALTGANSVNAVSDYDNVITQATDLIMTDPVQGPHDFSLEWYNEGLEAARIRCEVQGLWCGSYTSLRDFLLDGSWIVIKLSNNTYQIAFTSDPNANCNFATDMYSQKRLECSNSSNPFRLYTFSYGTNNPYQNSNKLVLTHEPEVYTTAIGFMQGTSFFINTMDTNYPPNYEGDIIPDSPPSPNETSDWTPEMRIDSVVNFKVTSSDMNFLTFDNVPFLCSVDGDTLVPHDEEGFAPILYWQLYNDNQTPDHLDDVLLKSGYQSATGQLEINFDDTGNDEGYRLTTWYDCSGSLEFEFPSHEHFKVRKDGILDESAIFATCVSTEFPFIHLDACIGGMKALTSFAAIGVPKFANAWTPNQNCNTLNVLDDWIGLEGNPALCPQVPNYVRAVITPFVTFILGLITIKFLARQTGKEF